MGLVSPIGSKIDFMGDPFFESAAWFFVIILIFILQPFLESKSRKKYLDTEKISFSKADFHKPSYI